MEIKKAFKGFDYKLSCRGEKFEVGVTYNKPNKDTIKLCSNDGWHYCNELEQIFPFYPMDNYLLPSNRYCEIEVLGNFVEDSQKGITTSFKIIREISPKEISFIILDKILGIEDLKKLCSSINCMIGGSVGLYLHGVILDRWRTSSRLSDWDLIVPYYQHLGEGNYPISRKRSGNDFDYSYKTYDSLNKGARNIDIKVDNKQRYEIIEHDGFKFKVAPLEEIIYHKARYAMQGNIKHKNDLKLIYGAN